MRNLTRDNRWHSGGGGLASTASDYLRFCQMLLNGGELDGVRIVSPKTVAHMAADHLPPDVQYGETAHSRFGALAPVPEMGYGFGLGFAVRKAQGMSPVRARSASSSGAAPPAPISGSTRKSRWSSC